MENVNWLSMVISTIIPTITGFIWYHKSLFGSAWMDSIGLTEEKMKDANMGLIFGLSFVMAFLLSFFLINFNNGIGQEGDFDSFKHGAFHGAFIGIVVVTPVLVSGGLFEHRSAKNILINVGYWIITLVLMGGVLDAMNHWPNTIG